MARFYANENFPLPVVQELRRLGHDVVTIQETGYGNREFPDEQVLAYASADQRAVLTINRKHFIKLHSIRPDHSGIVVCTFDPNFKAQAGRIDQAARSFDSLVGELIRVNRPA